MSLGHGRHEEVCSSPPESKGPREDPLVAIGISRCFGCRNAHGIRTSRRGPQNPLPPSSTGGEGDPPEGGWECRSRPRRSRSARSQRTWSREVLMRIRSPSPLLAPYALRILGVSPDAPFAALGWGILRSRGVRSNEPTAWPSLPLLQVAFFTRNVPLLFTFSANSGK